MKPKFEIGQKVFYSCGADIYHEKIESIIQENTDKISYKFSRNGNWYTENQLFLSFWEVAQQQFDFLLKKLERSFLILNKETTND